MCYFIAQVAGDVLYLFWARGRRNVRENVACILGSEVSPDMVKKVARQCMRNFCKYAIDFLRFSSLQPSAKEDKISVFGLENLNIALEEGKGAILVSLHIGNWDLGVRFISELGYKVSAIVDNIRIGQLDRFVKKYRANMGVRLIATREGVSKMVEVLRRNELLALLIDSPKYEKGIEVKFGDRLAALPAGAATLALRTGAKIIPCGLVRLPNNTFLGIIGRHVHFQPSGDLARDIRDLTQRVAFALEEMARRFADQWYMFRPLSKRTCQS